MEGFVDVKGYEGKYMINIEGKVWSVRTNKFKKLYNDDGYYRVIFNANEHHRIHRLIGLHFIPNPENLPYIDHIDLNKLNNNIDNLRWVSSSTNGLNKKKQSNNTSGYKNITIGVDLRNKNPLYSWRIGIMKDGVILFRGQYSQKKYTIEQVIAIRDEKYIELGIKKYD